MTTAGISAEPLAVWDVNERDGWFHAHASEASEWAKRHIDDADRTYRIEFFADHAIVYRYVLNDDGRKWAGYRNRGARTRRTCRPAA